MIINELAEYCISSAGQSDSDGRPYFEGSKNRSATGESFQDESLLIFLRRIWMYELTN